MNLLPLTEKVRRQSRLLLLMAVGATVASGFWVSTSTWTQRELIASLQESIALTESRIVPIPPLNNRVNALRAELAERDEVLAYGAALPDLVAPTEGPVSRVLEAFATDGFPEITLERVRLARVGMELSLELSGRAFAFDTIRARLTDLNEIGIAVSEPTTNLEEDGTTTFGARLGMPLVAASAESMLREGELAALLMRSSGADEGESPTDEATEPSEAPGDAGSDPSAGASEEGSR